MRVQPASIDAYLATVTEPQRTALAGLRATIRSILPKAEEGISYRIPAFRVDGAVVAGFCATAKGCSYFPFSGKTLKTLAAELRAYSQTKSALHFAPETPLPKTLLRKLLKARLAEVMAKPTKPSSAKRRPTSSASRTQARSSRRSSAKRPPRAR